MSDHLPQERVLLLLPTLKDCTLSREILHQAGIGAHPCTSMAELCDEAAKGAGAVILTEEAILGNGRERLGTMLRAQPDWSDLPLIVLTAAGAESAERTRALLNLGHMTLMKRPVEVSTLVTAVQAALRDRRRQYLIRDHIDQIARQAEALRASENRYRALADNVQQLFWTCTAEGLCDYVSAQWVNYTGIPEAQQLGMGWLSLVIHPDDRERTGSRWEAATRGQAPYDLEYRIKAADGTYRWFKVRGTPIRDQQGEIVRWFGTCTDIEDQKQAEAALQAADRKKNEFLAMLAHELRNPLASVGTAVQLLEFPNAQAEIPWVHDVIARQVKQFGRLIDDLLDVSRITRGTIELRTETLDAAQRVLERAQESVRPIVDERGHQLFVSFAAEPLWMMADPTRLEQIVVNLLTNAAKYTPANGKIWLTACREEDSIVIRVRDNGIGIPPEKLPEMFELFTQGDRSLARSEGGLGVGLTLVKSLVELHGGSVVAKSGGPGQGTEFILRFPATEPQPHPRRAPRRPHHPGRTRRSGS